jgi:hypothetical protein
MLQWLDQHWLALAAVLLLCFILSGVRELARRAWEILHALSGIAEHLRRIEDKAEYLRRIDDKLEDEAVERRGAEADRLRAAGWRGPSISN